MSAFVKFNDSVTLMKRFPVVVAVDDEARNDKVIIATNPLFTSDIQKALMGYKNGERLDCKIL